MRCSQRENRLNTKDFLKKADRSSDNFFTTKSSMNLSERNEELKWFTKEKKKK